MTVDFAEVRKHLIEKSRQELENARRKVLEIVGDINNLLNDNYWSDQGLMPQFIDAVFDVVRGLGRVPTGVEIGCNTFAPEEWHWSIEIGICYDGEPFGIGDSISPWDWQQQQLKPHQDLLYHIRLKPLSNENEELSRYYQVRHSEEEGESK